MAIDSFIPELWSARLELDFREQAVAANLVNRSYEGEAARGNVVKINTAGPVTIYDYEDPDGTGTKPRTTTPEAVSTTSVDLLIDQARNYDFYVDDIDAAQAAGSLAAFTQSAAEGLAEDADKFILSTAVTNADPGNLLTPAELATGDAAWNALRDLRKLLNKAHVPLANRVAVINSEFEAVLLEAASKITNVDTSGSPAGLREATLGRILGFTVVTSENLPVTDAPQAVAFYSPAVAYVSQIMRPEAMRAHDRFADRLRGLHVYGAKVIRPKAVAVCTVTPTP